MLTRIPILDRERFKLVLALMCAVACGIVVGLRPTGAVVVAAVAAGATACLLLPIRYLPPLLLAITIVMPSLVFEGIGGSGQARAVIAILLLTLLRALIARNRIEVPGILPLAVGDARTTLLTTLVATSRPASQVGGNSDLVRDLSFPAAAIVGFLGGAAARREGTALSVARGFACLGLIAAFLSYWYWAWHTLGFTPLSSSLFNHALTSSGFSSSRSVFPFIEDSPMSAR